MNSYRTAAAFVVLMILAGCGEQDTPQPTEADKTSGKAASASNAGGKKDAVTHRVLVTQGTNLAPVAHPETGDVVFSLQGVLFHLSAGAVRARAITDYYHDAREPALSSDGTVVVFQGYRNGNWDIFAQRVEATPDSAPQAVTSDSFDDREPFLVPGATQSVVFSSDRGGSYDVWQVTTSGGPIGSPDAQAELRQLTHSVGNANSPAVSADGQSLAYAQSLPASPDFELRVMPISGGNSRAVVTEPGEIAGISWDAGGQKLSYVLMHRDANGALQTSLRVVSVGGTTPETTPETLPETISEAGSDVFPFRATWMGETLMFAADGGIRRGIPGGSFGEMPFEVELALTRPPYERRRRNHDDTSTRRALGLASPALSPDGESVVFSALGDLWQWRHASEELTQLTDDAFAEQTPVFAPDGKSVVFVGERQGSTELRRLQLSDRSVTPIKVRASSVSDPSLSPDGTKLAFFAAVPGNPLAGQLTVLDFASGDTETVLAPMPAQPVSWGHAGLRIDDTSGAENRLVLATTRLNTYSSRYREGVYELVLAPLGGPASGAGGEPGTMPETTPETAPETIVPMPHRSIMSAALTPDGRAVTYVQDGVLQILELGESLTPEEGPRVLINELVDSPSWSADGEHLVFQSGDALKLFSKATQSVTDITPNIPWQPDQPRDKWVLRAGRMFDGETNAYRENVDILVQGHRIAEIRPAGEVPEGMRVIDASDSTVIPGLFEMHAHMGLSSEVQGRVWLAFGVTSVRDPGSNPYVAKERQEAWDSGRRLGPRTHITGYLTDGNRVYYAMAEGVTSDAHLERSLDRARRLKLDFIKTYVRLPDHQQRRVVEFAHGIGIPVSSHELFPAVAHGMDHVEHIGGTSRRGYRPKVSMLGHSYQDVVALLSESGMGLTATAVLPGFSVVVSQQPDFFNTAQFAAFYGEKARKGYELVMQRFGRGAEATTTANGELLRTLTDRGALLVTGTDSPFVPYGAGLHAELRLYARAGLSGYEVLHSATVKSARAAGVDHDLGRLAPGMLADMVVVDGDPLVNIADADNVRLTVKNGRAYSLEELMTPR